MQLAKFISENRKTIIDEWENFALTIISPSEGGNLLFLRDHIDSILEFIVSDMQSPQTHMEQTKKSQGHKKQVLNNNSAEIHASERLAVGFNMEQMVSEYRALRASITRLWTERIEETDEIYLFDLIRFNESIDQQLTESIGYYTKKLDHSRNMFLGILGHDLRTPLGAAKMSADLALYMGSLSEREEMLFTQVSVSVERAIEIIDNLLDLTRSRLGSGLPIFKEMMDMQFVAKALIDEIKALHPTREILFLVSGDTVGKWDRSRVGQVFSNLLGNAIQYGAKDLPISVVIAGTEKEMIFSVHNWGKIIEPKAIKKIFDTLTRGASESESHGSTNMGLGLYIVNEIVTAHGGTIRVSSDVNEGTMFKIFFPR